MVAEKMRSRMGIVPIFLARSRIYLAPFGSRQAQVGLLVYQVWKCDLFTLEVVLVVKPVFLCHFKSNTKDFILNQ